MTTSGLPASGTGLPHAERPSGWPTWTKLVVVLILLASLGWVLLIAVQYFRTKKPIQELPGVPPQVAGIFRHLPPQYVQSLDGVQRPLGVAVAQDGRIYVTESAGQRMVHVFSSDGEELLSFAPPGTGPATRVPVYVAVSPAGEVYVTDRDAATVYIFSGDGTLLGEVASPLPEEEEWHPLGIAFDEEGNLYVTDVTPGKHRVVVMDPAGDLKMVFGTQGSADGEFWFPNAVAVDKEGHIYVSDSNNGRIQVFDSSGQYLQKISRGLARGDLSLPRGIVIDDENRLFVVDTSRHVVQVYDVSETPRFLYAFGGGQESASPFSFPNGVALGDDGQIYVTDRENNRVQVWRY